jgi:CBS domain-containing protein
MKGGRAMKVAELMKTDLKTVDADATVADAVSILSDAHVSALPVTDARGRLLGVVSTTDVLAAIAETSEPEARERMFEETHVRDLMTAPPQVIGPETDALEAARRMLYLEVHRLFVVADGALVGVVSQTDIVGALATAKL